MRLVLKVYFRKQHISGLENIPKEGPFLIVANHPSSFLDPIAIAVLVKQNISFLAKATMFKNKLIAKILQAINLVPIYRAQDNPQKVKENKAVFKACYDKLSNNGVIMIFPEGTSENERRLRKIKTGAARIALGAAKEHHLNVKILPVGLNYTKSSKFRSEISIEFGEPLSTNDFNGLYSENEIIASKKLTEKIETSIKKLIINIDKLEYDELVEKLEVIYKTELTPNTKLPTIISQEIVENVKYFQENNPSHFSEVKTKIELYFEKLSQVKISDKNIGTNQKKVNLFIITVLSLSKLILGFPIWLVGITLSFIPYKLTRVFAISITKEEAFYGALLMSLGTLLFTVFYSFSILFFWFIFKHPIITLVYALTLPFIGLFTIYYSRFARKIYYNWSFISKFYSKNEFITKLIIEREMIITELNTIRNELKPKH